MATNSDSAKKGTFEDLGVAPWLCRLCRHVGLVTPTSVQRECIPRALRGDTRIAACAPTGSGKTAAFVLPIIQDLSADTFGVFAIVLSPTRELATQIADQFHLFGTGVGVRVALLVGGVKQGIQLKAVETRSHIIVGTPGRARYVLEHAAAENSTRYIRYIVLDEADKLLGEQEHSDDVVELCTFLRNERLRDPEKVRFMMFSATLDHASAWAQLGLGGSGEGGDEVAHPSGLIQCDGDGNLTEEFMLVPNHVKLAHLVNLLSPPQCKWNCVMIFVNSRRRAELVRLTLQLLGLSVTGMHALQNQQQRNDALTLFKLGAAKFLVCTDVFARGIDVAGIDCVIHFDFPASSVRYRHRAGRTARGGNNGLSLVLVTERDLKLFRKLEQRLERTMRKRRPAKENVILKTQDVLTHALLEAKAIVARQYPREDVEHDFKEEEKEGPSAVEVGNDSDSEVSAGSVSDGVNEESADVAPAPAQPAKKKIKKSAGQTASTSFSTGDVPPRAPKSKKTLKQKK